MALFFMTYTELQRLEAEYSRHTQMLESELASIARRSTPRKFVAIEYGEREIARLQQGIDRVAEAIFQTEIDMEARGRIELISPATNPR